MAFIVVFVTGNIFLLYAVVVLYQNWSGLQSRDAWARHLVVWS